MNFSVDYINNHLTPKRTPVLQDLQLDELPVENIQAVHTDVNSRAFQNQQNQVKVKYMIMWFDYNFLHFIIEIIFKLPVKVILINLLKGDLVYI